MVVVVPDRHGRGTNALLLSPPDAIPFCVRGRQPGRPRSVGPVGRRTHSRSTARCRSTSTRPRTSLAEDSACSTRPMAAEPEPGRRRSPDRCRDRPEPGGSPEVVALDGPPRGPARRRPRGLISAALERWRRPSRPRSASARRRPGRDPEGRLEGRGRDRRSDRDRAAARGGRVRRALGPRSAPGRGRPARGAPGRPDGQRGADHRDAARLRVRQRRRRRLERRARVGLDRDPPAGRPGCLGARIRARSGPGPGSTSRSSSRTASGGRGAGASSTWRSASPGSLPARRPARHARRRRPDR